MSIYASLKPCAVRLQASSNHFQLPRYQHNKPPTLFTKGLGTRDYFSPVNQLGTPNLSRRMIKQLTPQNAVQDIFPWNSEQLKDFDPIVPENLRQVFEPLYISLKYGNLVEWKRRGIFPPRLIHKNLKELGSQHSISFAQALTSMNPDAPIHYFKDKFKEAPIMVVNAGCGDSVIIFGDNKSIMDHEDKEIFKEVVQHLKEYSRSEPPEFIFIGNVDSTVVINSDIMQYKALGTLIEIGLPSATTRKTMFDWLLFSYGCDKDIVGLINIDELSFLTEGFKSSAIREVIRYANVLSLTRLVKMGYTENWDDINPKDQILQKDFQDAIVVIQNQS